MAEIALRKSIIVSKYPNQYPACWVHVNDENEKIEGPKQQSFDIEATTALMEHTHKLTSLKNNNSEDDDWEIKVLKFGWTQKQTKLFNKVVRILDYDRLSRLSCIGENKRQEILQVRMTIDKSAGRMRKALASVEWEVGVIQWLHTILMENLPATYLAYYLDIMQTLKSIVPSLVDKMIFWKPSGNINQDLLASVLKKPWQPTLVHMYRKLQGNALIVVIPPLPRVSSTQPPRIQRLFTLFTTMSPILPIQLNTVTSLNQQSLQSWAEQTISITRSKIQELKNENPDRRLLLIGMHSSSSIALQVALVEQVSGVVCFGFSYNTVHGSRGLPDDHLLKLNCPILFMIGQNSVRSSEEELEIIREKLNQNSLLQTITVGGADDFLRISKKKRKFEGLTQEMVDNLIVDEIADYASKCVQRPIVQSKQTDNGVNRLVDSSTSQIIRKRKNSLDEFEMPKLTKVSKIKTPSINSSSSEITERAVQSIIADLNESAKSEKPFVIQRGETTLKPVKRVFSNSPFYSNNQGKKFVTDFKPTPMQQITSSVPRSTARSIAFNALINQTTVLNARGKFVPLVHHQKLNSFSPPKFTIVRSSAPSSTSPNQSYLLDNADDASILNMPIVFADNEGNLVGNSSSTATTTIRKESIPPSDSTGNMNKIIFRTTQKNLATNTKQVTPIQNQMPTVTITKNKNILIQKPTQAPKNFLVLNGLVGRPVSASNIIIPQHQNLATGQMIKIPQKHVISPSTSNSHPAIREAAGKKIEIIDNTVIKPASQLAQPKNISFVNLAESKTFPNKISISNSTIKKGQLVVKTSSLKPITLSGAKQFGNITVNKFSTLSNVASNVAKGKPNNPTNKPPTA